MGQLRLLAWAAICALTLTACPIESDEEIGRNRQDEGNGGDAAVQQPDNNDPAGGEQCAGGACPEPGADCEADADCDEGEVCLRGACLPEQGEDGVPCNGVDDDRDGRVDEDHPEVGLACEVGVGACLAQGVFECTPAGGAICNARQVPPADEACNRIDDDCDGVVDENACNGPVDPPVEEQCNGQDDDGDGRIDEGLGQGGFACMPCRADDDCPEGLMCLRGQCAVNDNPGGGNMCKQEEEEVCNGLDDDCDGQVDENACNGPIDPPAEEQCNGLDEDGDGRIDEGLEQADGQPCIPCRALGGCPDGLMCVEGQCIADGDPNGGEVCNGRDDDGDGIVDNGENLCPDGEFCANGQCQRNGNPGGGGVPGGDPGNGDPGNGDPDDPNGGGNMCKQQEDEACNGLDDDCDGVVDENACNGQNPGGNPGGDPDNGGDPNGGGAFGGPDPCNGQDDDGDGRVDEGWAGLACEAVCIDDNDCANQGRCIQNMCGRR